MKVYIGKYSEDYKKRTERIRIDDYDVSNMDTTLALIIIPMLVKLKDKKIGAPIVDYEDVPKKLRPTKKEIKKCEKDGDLDNKFFERWEYVLNEIIWSFQQLIDKNAEDKFFSEILYLHTYHALNYKKNDLKGLNNFRKRLQKGFELFGKYYICLWT